MEQFYSINVKYMSTKQTAFIEQIFPKGLPSVGHYTRWKKSRRLKKSPCPYKVHHSKNVSKTLPG